MCVINIPKVQFFGIVVKASLNLMFIEFSRRAQYASSCSLTVCRLRTLGASLVLTYLHVNLFVNYLSASRILTLFIYVLCCEMPFWQHHLISFYGHSPQTRTHARVFLSPCSYYYSIERKNSNLPSHYPLLRIICSSDRKSIYHTLITIHFHHIGNKLPLPVLLAGACVRGNGKKTFSLPATSEY